MNKIVAAIMALGTALMFGIWVGSMPGSMFMAMLLLFLVVKDMD